MLKTDIETNIDSIPYLLYMTSQEKNDNAETALPPDSLFDLSSDEEKRNNADIKNKPPRRLI